MWEEHRCAVCWFICAEVIIQRALNTADNRRNRRVLLRLPRRTNFPANCSA